MRNMWHHIGAGLRQRTRWSVFVCAALTSSLVTQVYGLGLGKMNVKSALDEPLLAEIELQPGAPRELESLTLSLGSREDFRRANIQRDALPDDLKITVSETRSTPVIRVTTEQPYVEPYLHFLLLAQWSGGKMVREYTALLDPPMYVTDMAPASTAAGNPAQSATTSRPLTEPSSTQSIVAVPVEAVETGATPWAAPADRANESAGGDGAARAGLYGPTTAGDTLWTIGLTLRDGTGLDLFQIMAALYRENPGAFTGDNMHRLKVGQTLRLVDPATIRDIPAENARLLYDTHLAEWNRALGAMYPALDRESAALQEASTTQSAGVTTSSSDGSNPSPAVAGEPTVSISPVLAYRGLDQRINYVERKLVDNSARISDIEETLAVVQRSLDRQAAPPVPSDEDEVNAAANHESASATQPVSDAPGEAIADNAQSASQGGAGVVDRGANGTPAVDPVTPELVSAIAKLDPTEGTRKPEPAVASQPPGGSQSFAQPLSETPTSAKQVINEAVSGRAGVLDTAGTAEFGPPGGAPRSSSLGQRDEGAFWIGFNWYTAALVGFLLLLLGLLVYLRRRRHDADMESVILETGDGSTVTSGDESITVASDDVRQRTGTFASTLRDFEIPGLISGQEKVDALAEAEIYIAYGREEQAEVVLKEALKENRDRPECKFKLLEIYRRRNDVAAFESLAEEYYAAAGSRNSEQWQKIMSMGRELNPTNLLFVGDGEDAGSEIADGEYQGDTLGDVATQGGGPVDADAEGGQTVSLQSDDQDGQESSDEEMDFVLPELDDPDVIYEVETEPLAQADLYLAYGHVDQAVTSLTEALEKSPDDQRLKLKLLEVYAQGGQRTVFERLAQQLEAEPDEHLHREVQTLRDKLVASEKENSIADPDIDIDLEDAVVDVAVDMPVEPSTDVVDMDLDLGDMVEEAVAAPGEEIEEHAIAAGSDDHTLKERIASLEKTLAEREDENHRLYERLKLLEEQAGGLMSAGDGLEDILDVQDQVDEPVNSRIQWEEDPAPQALDVDELRQRIAALEEALHAREIENQALQQKMERLEEKVTAMIEQLRELGIDVSNDEDIAEKVLKLRNIGGAG